MSQASFEENIRCIADETKLSEGNIYILIAEYLTIDRYVEKPGKNVYTYIVYKSNYHKAAKEIKELIESYIDIPHEHTNHIKIYNSSEFTLREGGLFRKKVLSYSTDVIEKTKDDPLYEERCVKVDESQFDSTGRLDATRVYWYSPGSWSYKR